MGLALWFAGLVGLVIAAAVASAYAARCEVEQRTAATDPPKPAVIDADASTKRAPVSARTAPRTKRAKLDGKDAAAPKADGKDAAKDTTHDADAAEVDATA